MKRFITLFLCALLAVSMCACRSGQPEEPTEAERPNASVQTGNPWGEVDGPAAFHDQMGIDLEAPEGAENCRYSILYVSAQIAQIQFSYEETEYTLRASKKEGDISGVYGSFEETGMNHLVDHPAGSFEVRIRYTTDGGAVADWVMLDLQYALSASQIADREDFSAFVLGFITEKLDTYHERHQQYLRESLASAACEGHVEITSGGEAYAPYVTVAYSFHGQIASDSPPVDFQELQSAELLPSILYCDDFTVDFTDGGKLDHVILYDGEYNRLEDRWDLDFFTELEPGTYFVNIIMHEDRLGGAYTGYQCAFQLTVP